MDDEERRKTESFKKSKSLSAKAQSSVPHIEKPTPLDFDSFIPWICLELQVPYNVYVFRTAKEEYIPRRKHSHVKWNKTELKLHESTKKSTYVKPAVQETRPFYVDGIPVIAIYDNRSRLTEISIVESPYEVPRKLIIAFTLCLPFHNYLSKISIRKGNINVTAIQEISKLLPHSNITSIFLEECYVPDGKYYLFLDHLCQLQNLALRRLGMGDEDCKIIAEKLDISQPAAKCLLTLDLSSNKLTNETAYAFGDVLRRNRSLLHLNLSDNKINDDGFVCILESLVEFSITEQEMIDKKQRRFEYFIRRIAFFKQSHDIIRRQSEKEQRRTTKSIASRKQTVDTSVPPKRSPRKSNKTTTLSVKTINELAEKMTRLNIGDFNDPFDEQRVVYYRKSEPNCVGNLILCSLNIAYNNISYVSICKILAVLQYQRHVMSRRPLLSTGLIRVVFEGNNLPINCDEYVQIKSLLNKSVVENMSMPNLVHSSPSTKSTVSRRSTTPTRRSVGRSSASVKK